MKPAHVKMITRIQPALDSDGYDVDVVIEPRTKKLTIVVPLKEGDAEQIWEYLGRFRRKGGE